MGKRLRYRKKASEEVTAIQLDLDTAGFRYRKWGGLQRAKRGDWLVENSGEVYTIDGKTFARTYKPMKSKPGRYVKKTFVWAEVATEPGRLRTKEGTSGYQRGDYLVYNERSGADGYCMTAKRFEGMYERA